jgi:hypothetical protein
VSFYSSLCNAGADASLDRLRAAINANRRANAALGLNVNGVSAMRARLGIAVVEVNLPLDVVRLFLDYSHSADVIGRILASKQHANMSVDCLRLGTVLDKYDAQPDVLAVVVVSRVDHR